MKKVDISCELRGPQAAINVELTYVNPSKKNPVECTYIFPLDKGTLLSKFEASIDGREIETQIMEKEKADVVYDDAIAGGNAAVLAKRSAKKKEETLTLKLGNLNPGAEATLKL